MKRAATTRPILFFLEEECLAQTAAAEFLHRVPLPTCQSPALCLFSPAAWPRVSGARRPRRRARVGGGELLPTAVDWRGASDRPAARRHHRCCVGGRTVPPGRLPLAPPPPHFPTIACRFIVFLGGAGWPATACFSKRGRGLRGDGGGGGGGRPTACRPERRTPTRRFRPPRRRHPGGEARTGGGGGVGGEWRNSPPHLAAPSATRGALPPVAVVVPGDGWAGAAAQAVYRRCKSQPRGAGEGGWLAPLRCP